MEKRIVFPPDVEKEIKMVEKYHNMYLKNQDDFLIYSRLKNAIWNLNISFKGLEAMGKISTSDKEELMTKYWGYLNE